MAVAPQKSSSREIDEEQIDMGVQAPLRLRGEDTYLSSAALVELSLRNHVCFSLLRTEHGMAFHLGTIVRTMFASFFLFEAGLGKGEMNTFTEVDMTLGEVALRVHANGPCSLSLEAVNSTAKLLKLYDSQLQSSSLKAVIEAHQRAEQNFRKPTHERLSIAALVQRSRRRFR
ncbi:Fis family transcriptional regulator [Caballeronia calidae]|uniref:Fis family transcriptional regulator n=1 Tax=Caballeronia calidae TaxID=1777139 RepID=A0A158A834_9BURK|nr:hypothetical protein [Caballeronia calidae]SAK53994.1 Fis family transcriptional regulator [Caballeronia calidae]